MLFVMPCYNPNNIHEVIIKLGEIIINIDKLLSDQWPPYVLTQLAHRSVYVAKFNSHHTQWKYRGNDKNIFFVFDAKHRSFFKSASMKSRIQQGPQLRSDHPKWPANKDKDVQKYLGRLPTKPTTNSSSVIENKHLTHPSLALGGI